MSRSSTRRGQTAPIPALVAVLAVCLGISLYAGVLADAVPERDRDLAGPTLDRVADGLTETAVARPGRLSSAVERGPDGYDLRATLTAGGERWSVGPAPPESGDADEASRGLPVRLGPGEIVPGRLRVVVWR